MPRCQRIRRSVHDEVHRARWQSSAIVAKETPKEHGVWCCRRECLLVGAAARRLCELEPARTRSNTSLGCIDATMRRRHASAMLESTGVMIDGFADADCVVAVESRVDASRH